MQDYQEYKGFEVRTIWTEGNVNYGMATLGSTIVTFQAPTEERLETEFHTSVDDYYEWLAEENVA